MVAEDTGAQALQLPRLLELFTDEELAVACRNARVERGGGRKAVAARLAALVDRGGWSVRRLLRAFDRAALTRCRERHFPRLEGDTVVQALARVVEDPAPQPRGRPRPRVPPRPPSRPPSRPRPPGVPPAPREEVARARLLDFLRSRSWAIEEISSDVFATPSERDRGDRLAELRALHATREGAPAYAAVVKPVLFPTRQALRAGLSQAVAEAAAFSRALPGVKPLGVVAVRVLSERMRFDAGEYLAVVHPGAAFGFVDGRGRIELDADGLREDGPSIAVRLRSGSRNVSDDLGDLLRFRAGQLMLRRLLERAETPGAAPLDSATELAELTGHGITVPTAAEFVNTLAQKGFLLPGRVALDPRRIRELFVETRSLQRSVGLAPPGYRGAGRRELLALLAEAAAHAKARVVLAASTAAVERGLRPPETDRPVFAYVAASELSPLRAALRSAWRKRGIPVTTCALEDAALVLVTPPRATAILDAATPGATPPLLVSDAVQIWLDGRDWTGEAEGDSSGGPDVRTQDVAARSRAAAAAAVEALRPLLAPSRRR